MKDRLKRTLSALIGAAGIAYIAWMMAQHQNFVVDSLLPNQMWVGIGFIALFLIFIYSLSLKPIALKRLKWWVVIYAVVLIFLGHYTLINDTTHAIYAGDVVTFIGVLIFFLGIGGALLTKKVKQEVEKAMQEIIEV